MQQCYESKPTQTPKTSEHNRSLSWWIILAIQYMCVCLLVSIHIFALSCRRLNKKLRTVCAVQYQALQHRTCLGWGLLALRDKCAAYSKAGDVYLYSTCMCVYTLVTAREGAGVLTLLSGDSVYYSHLITREKAKWKLERWRMWSGAGKIESNEKIREKVQCMYTMCVFLCVCTSVCVVYCLS